MLQKDQNRDKPANSMLTKQPSKPVAIELTDRELNAICAGSGGGGGGGTRVNIFNRINIFRRR
jgi:hypothetical protein